MKISRRYQSEVTSASALAASLHLSFSKRDASNRFMKAAMTERLSSWDPKDVTARGVPGAMIIEAYKRWGEGDIGLIVTGSIAVALDQIGAAGDPVIPLNSPLNGKRFQAFSDLAQAGKLHGSLILGQVNHPGAKVDARVQRHLISASASKTGEDVFGFPAAPARAATTHEIDEIVSGFAYAAVYLERAGFDGMEVHAAHGYLRAQCLSANTNLRSDQYGGNLHDRTRLIAEIAQAVRRKTRPSFVLGIKLNSVEFQKQGFR